MVLWAMGPLTGVAAKRGPLSPRGVRSKLCQGSEFRVVARESRMKSLGCRV